MSDKPEYPARGEMSANKQFYTHTDGSVHRFTPYPAGYFDDNKRACRGCSFDADADCLASGTNCDGGYFTAIEGAYVPTVPTEAEAAIAEACEMARAMVKRCSRLQVSGCAWCKTFTSQQCDARRYLAKHGQDDAWAADMKGGEI